MPELPTGTVTFLFTDIEVSTKAVQRLGTESYNETKVTRRVQIRVSGMARLMRHSCDSWSRKTAVAS
jgi:hypothetical protein